MNMSQIIEITLTDGVLHIHWRMVVEIFYEALVNCLIKVFLWNAFVQVSQICLRNICRFVFHRMKVSFMAFFWDECPLHNNATRKSVLLVYMRTTIGTHRRKLFATSLFHREYSSICCALVATTRALPWVANNLTLKAHDVVSREFRASRSSRARGRNPPETLQTESSRPPKRAWIGLSTMSCDARLSAA